MRQGLHPLLDVIDSFSCAYPLLACASCQSRKYSPCFFDTAVLMIGPPIVLTGLFLGDYIERKRVAVTDEV